MLLISSLLLLALASCRQQNVAVTARPTHDELIELEEPTRSVGFNAAVEDVTDTPRYTLTPTYEFELTPEEQKYVKKEEPPEVDALTLYKPPPLPARGVDPYGVPASISSWGVDTMQSAPDPLQFTSRYGTWDYAGRYHGETLFARPPVGVVGLPRRPGGQAYDFSWTAKIGEGLPRTGAAHLPRIED